MRNILNNKSGFTLIEILVAILISGVVITAVYQILNTSSVSNSYTNDQIAASNAMDSTIENIRLMTLHADTMRICDASTASPAEGETVIKCVDNVVYIDDKQIGSAEQYGVDRIELKFDRGLEDTMLKVELNCLDEAGGLIGGKYRSIDLYLHSLGGDGSGKVETSTEGQRDCIIFTTMEQ